MEGPLLNSLIVYCRVSSNFHFSLFIILCLVQKYCMSKKSDVWLVGVCDGFSLDRSKLSWDLFGLIQTFFILSKSYPNFIQTGGVVQFCRFRHCANLFLKSPPIRLKLRVLPINMKYGVPGRLWLLPPEETTTITLMMSCSILGERWRSEFKGRMQTRKNHT